MKQVKMIALSLTMLTMFTSTISHAEDSDVNRMLIETYVQEFHVSHDEAVRRLEMMNDSYPLIDELKGVFGDSITAIYFDNGDEFKLVVRTTAKGRDLKELRDLIGTKNKIPVLIIRNSLRNSQAISNIIENQSARLSRQIEGFSFMGYDPTKDKIIIHIYQPDLSKQEEIKNSPSLQNISGFNTEIVFLNEPLEVYNLKGGAPIN